MAADGANRNSSWDAGVFDSSDNWLSHHIEMGPGGKLLEGEQKKVRLTSFCVCLLENPHHEVLTD